MECFDVVYLAAGQGLRANLGMPKQLALLGGKPVMVHALELFESMPEVAKIVIAGIPGRLDVFRAYLTAYEISKAACVAGGRTRQESVRNALRMCDTTRVIVHEAVRPFITAEFVRSITRVAGRAVVPVVGVVPTIVDSRSLSYPARKYLGEVQLPQVFDREILAGCHDVAALQEMEYTDDSSLVYAATGIFPKLVPGLPENIKITTPLDIKVAEAIYDERCGRNRS